MKILAIVPSIYDTSPGQRFRLEQWEPLLLEKGVEIVYSSFESEELRKVLYQKGSILQKFRVILKSMNQRRKDLATLEDFDLVYIFREAAILGPVWFEKKIERFGVPIVFDFDDAVFVAYKSPSNGYLSYLKFPSKTGKICQLSSHVMAGNQYLADYAGKFNNRVSIVPTTIDTKKYSVVEKCKNPEIVTIGWSGSHSTVQHLDTIREVIQDLANNEKFRLRVIGTSDYALSGVDVEAMQWNSETEVEDLGAIDIGLMPLPDDDWSKGKCGLKALQYMALGTPTLCSPVGNTKIIQDGKNGFIASSKDEWVEKLKRLIHSFELRTKLGLAGRKTVEDSYSAEVQAPRVYDILKSIVEKKL